MIHQGHKLNPKKMKQLLILTIALISYFSATAQIPPQYAVREAVKEAKRMKEEGVLVIRLETAHTKVKMLERALTNENLKKRKRKRLQMMLDETVLKRDKMNQAIVETIRDTFDFCPYYISYDTSAADLKEGKRSGIFYNTELEKDENISIPDSAEIYILYYHEKSGNHPSDGLIIRRLKSTLSAPFPDFTAIRESFINDINTPRVRRAIPQIQNRLRRLYKKAMEKEE
jgi:hypothetical protein